MQEVKRVSNLEEQAILEQAPAYSFEKADAEFVWVKETGYKWGMHGRDIPDKPEAYWDYLNRYDMLFDALRRMSVSDDQRTSSVGTSFLNQMGMHRKLSIRAKFDEKFGMDAVQAAQPGNLYKDQAQEVDIGSESLERFGEGYLACIPLMFIVFAIRLRVRGLMILPELWRMVPAAVLWPLGLAYYPHDIRRQEQIRTATYFVSQLASVSLALIGFGPFVPVVKAQVKKSGSSSTSQKDSRRTSSVGIGLEWYPQTSGVNEGFVLSPNYRHSHKLPEGFTLSGFGFVETGGGKVQPFTNHVFDFSHADAGGAMFTFETGGSKAGPFVQMGPRVNLAKVPGLSGKVNKVAKSITAGPIWQIRGPTRHQEWFVAWASQETPSLFGFRLSSKGFMRFRPGPMPDIGQPQIVLRHKNIPHTVFASEFWMVGGHPTVRLGLQFAK